MNADEIVKALRLCAKLPACVEGCPEYKDCDDAADCYSQLMEKAADLIESLQAQLAEKALGDMLKNDKGEM